MLTYLRGVFQFSSTISKPVIIAACNFSLPSHAAQRLCHTFSALPWDSLQAAQTPCTSAACERNVGLISNSASCPPDQNRLVFSGFLILSSLFCAYKESVNFWVFLHYNCLTLRQNLRSVVVLEPINLPCGGEKIGNCCTERSKTATRSLSVDGIEK